MRYGGPERTYRVRIVGRPANFGAVVLSGRAVPHVVFDGSEDHLTGYAGLPLDLNPYRSQFGAKIPGPVMHLGPVNMEFDYARDFGASHSTGYERLMYDCMMGDATLFQRADMVEAGWNIVQSVMDVWKALPVRNFPNYASGTWGPKDADELLERDGRRWRNFEK